MHLNVFFLLHMYKSIVLNALLLYSYNKGAPSKLDGPALFSTLILFIESSRNLRVYCVWHRVLAPGMFSSSSDGRMPHTYCLLIFAFFLGPPSFNIPSTSPRESPYTNTVQLNFGKKSNFFGFSYSRGSLLDKFNKGEKSS